MQSRYLRWGLALLGLSGIITLFYPFSGDLGVADGWEWLGRFIIPVAVFPFFISFGFIAILATERPLHWMNPAGYIAAVLFNTIAFSDSFSYSTNDVWFAALFMIIPALCILLGIFRSSGTQSGARGLLALQGTYAVHLSFYLSGFMQSEHNIGYWFAALALLATLGQIVVLARQTWRIVALILPAAVMWVMVPRTGF
jgi:hypothetical protein